MSDSAERELHRQLRTSQDRYTYFLLAAAASAVALSVGRTEGRALSASMAPLVVAVIAWGLSFYFGCRHIEYVNTNIYGNIELLRIEAGTHSQLGRTPQSRAVASEKISEVLEANSRDLARYARWQFWLLMIGALFYIGWHVTEMTLRTLNGGGKV